MGGKVLKVDSPPHTVTCLVADSPHSGCDYPPDFGYSCDFAELRKAEDTGVDALYDFFPALGVPFLQAQFPRAYVDPNRRDTVTEKFTQEGDGDYHPSRDGLLRDKCTPRSAQKVYARKLTLSEVFNRVAGYYRPYHDRLKEMLDAAHERHGKVVHLNCHSMPSRLWQGKAQNPHDIVLGTRDGATCAPEVVEELRRLFAEKGYAVAIDAPGFRGAEIIRRTGDPAQGRHSIQVEINRRLYMDEDTLAPLPGRAKLKEDLREIMSAFADWCAALPPPPPAVEKRPLPPRP
jgi:N-formylglutamate amidohydrolase